MAAALPLCRLLPPSCRPPPACISLLYSSVQLGVLPMMQVCPLLLRVFPRLGAHHQLEDFVRRGDEPKDEVQVYTWMDATLR